MSGPLILTCDVGTQSVRVSLVDKNGEIVDKVKLQYPEPYFSPEAGWAEQKTGFYFDNLCAAGKELVSRNKERMPEVTACVITAFRNSYVFLDKDNKPTRNIIHWLDSRLCDFDNPFPFWKNAILKISGSGKGAQIAYRTSKVNWVRINQPEIWDRTEKILVLPAYLNFRMTGRMAASPANSIAQIPMDFEKKRWMGKNAFTRCIFDVPESKLFDLVPSGEIIGYVTKEASSLSGIPEGLPVIATGADKACETLGLSVADDSKAAVSFGTSSTIDLYTEKYFTPQPFLPSYPAVTNNAWNPEVQVFRGFWMISGFINEYCEKEKEEAETLGVSPEELMNSRASKVPAGCQGLLLQPYWTPDVLKPDSYGVILGFAPYHTKYHVYRAIIEGICFELYQSMKKMEQRGNKTITELYAGGGGSRSDLACQILADIFNLPVKRIHTHEASSIGAATVAFVATGEFNGFNEAVNAMVHVKDTFLPDAKNHEVYQKIYDNVYKKLYRKVKPLYVEMNELKKRMGF